MFTEITWKEYLIGITLVVIAYYSAMAFWLHLNRLYFKSKSPITTQDSEIQPLVIEKNEILPIEVNKLITLLSESIARCFHKGYSRGQLLQCLAKILSRYSSIKNTSFREQIQQCIINECEKYGPVGLRKSELKGLWNANTLQTVH